LGLQGHCELNQEVHSLVLTKRFNTNKIVSPLINISSIY
jgi:hypothetical protein